jgi:hypothetical protein
LMHDRNLCVGTRKVLVLGWSTRTGAAPTAVPRSINSRFNRNCRDCAVLAPPQLRTFPVYVRPVEMGVHRKFQGPCVPDLWRFSYILLNSHFNWLRVRHYREMEGILQCWHQRKDLWKHYYEMRTTEGITGVSLLSKTMHPTTGQILLHFQKSLYPWFVTSLEKQIQKHSNTEPVPQI